MCAWSALTVTLLLKKLFSFHQPTTNWRFRWLALLVWTGGRILNMCLLILADYLYKQDIVSENLVVGVDQDEEGGV